MKCLLILAVTIAAVAGSSNLFDPSVDAHTECCMCGDPVVRSYDGVYLMVLDAGKTLMTQWDDGDRNPCKFQVRCVTMDTYIEDSDTGPVWVDWCGIAVHPHSNPDKYFRNWLVGQNMDLFGERGQGYDGMIAICDAHYPDTRSFPYDGEDMSAWNPRVPKPNCETPYQIWIDDATNTISFRSDKDCCGWGLDLFVDGRNTCVSIYAMTDNDFIKRDVMGSAHLDGICQNMDGDTKNDWAKCSNGGPSTSLADIAESCKDGDHDGQAYQGGTKLDSFTCAKK